MEFELEYWSLGIMEYWILDPLLHYSNTPSLRQGVAIGKGVDFPPQRLVDYTLLREVQQELGMQ